MKLSKTWKVLLGGGVIAAVVGVIITFAIGSNPIMIGAGFMNTIFSIGNPKGKIEVELREPATEGEVKANRLANAEGITDPGNEWPSYNRTIYGDRYTSFTQINAKNAANLEVKCIYDTKRLEGFHVTPIVVEGALIATTAEDIFSLNPATCKENWRTHKNSGIGLMPTNRGAAYSNGKVIRGFPDGYVRAFEVSTGKQVWEIYIADPKKSLWLTSAAAAWNGMVFFGTAGGDIHNIRGRVFGINAETGKLLWQTFTVPQQADDSVHAQLGTIPTEKMNKTWGNPPDVPITGGGVWTTISIDPSTGEIYVPVGNPAPDFVNTLREGENLFTNTILVLDAKTGNYVRHHSTMESDWHDWDVSNAPIFYKTRGGRDVFSFHPKDGHLYTYDVTTNKRLFRKPVTKILNAEVKFEPGKEVYFCPGSVGGGEWNGAAFDPRLNLVFTGQNEWCTTTTIAKVEDVAKVPDGMIWFGVDYFNPYKLIGIVDPVEKWGGWIYANDADTGDWKWRARANYPTISGLAPTAGNILAFGDMGGNFRVLRSSDGKVLYENDMGGAIAGGVITYMINDKQYIALTSGTNHPQWPVKPHTGKIVIMGLKE